MNIALLDIGGTEIKYGMGYSEETIPSLAVTRAPSRAGDGAEPLQAQLLELLKDMSPFDRIGISTSGQVNPHSGVILFATDAFPRYAGTNLKQLCESEFGVPAFIQNDVNCAAIAEMQLGAGSQFGDFLYLTYGTGIGGAYVHNTELVLGSSFSAGEYGHIITHAGGAACACGNKGCYEAYASTRVLMEQLRRATSEEVTGKTLPRAMEGSPLVKQVFENWLCEVLAGLVSLVHAYNPAAVLLGGGIMENGWLVERITQELAACLIRSFAHVQVLPATFGNTAGLVGAFQIAKYDIY